MVKTYGYEAAKGIWARNVEGGIVAAFLISSLVVLCAWFFLTEDKTEGRKYTEVDEAIRVNKTGVSAHE